MNRLVPVTEIRPWDTIIYSRRIYRTVQAVDLPFGAEGNHVRLLVDDRHFYVPMDWHVERRDWDQ